MFCTLINVRIAFDTARATKMKTEWDIESAIATYNVEGWGEGYFTVNSSGNVEARPLKNDGGSIDLLEVVNEARARNLGFPLLIRFQDLLRHRVEAINRAFHSAIAEFGYKNQYRGVFPIKVNQLREVVEEIVDAVVRHRRDAGLAQPLEPLHGRAAAQMVADERVQLVEVLGARGE